MFIRSFAHILIIASSFVVVIGQTPNAPRDNAEKTGTSSAGAGTQKLSEMQFTSGVDLQFIIKELAREMGLNVLFDVDSFRSPGRKTSIDLKNVTPAAALDYILLQEKLFFEEAGPKTILIASQIRQRFNSPQIGVGAVHMTEQLASYFDAEGGMLIDTVRANSPASKAGLRAGDVIVEIDGVPVKGALGLLRAIDDRKGGEVILTIVRERKRGTICVTPERGIGSVLRPE